MKVLNEKQESEENTHTNTHTTKNHNNIQNIVKRRGGLHSVNGCR